MLSDGNAVHKDSGSIETVGDVFSKNPNSSVKLSEDEAVEFLNSTNMQIAYTLGDLKNFSMNPLNLSQKMGISKNEAESVLENLISLGLIRPSGGSDEYFNPTLHFDDSFIASSDILGIFIKFSQNSLAKITSKDIFGYRYEAMSKKVIQRYQSEIEDLMNRITRESHGKDDCEVYASSFSFTKVTRDRKAK